MTRQEALEKLERYHKIREELDAYLRENYTGPDRDWPNRYWEPGAEDAPRVLPEEQWIPDDVELPFK